jgi:hypothetical protein
MQAFSNGPNSAGVFLDAGSSLVTTPVTNPQSTSSDCPTTGCSVSLSTPSTSFSLNVGSGLSDTSVTASVDTGTPMDGPGGLGDSGCASYTPQSPDWYGFDVADTSRSKTITWTVKDTDPNNPFQVCFGAPYEFDVAGGGAAPAGTLPDGSSGFVGLLPTCPNIEVFDTTNGDFVATESEVAPPAFICANITSAVQTDGTTTTTATFTIPANLSGDPWMGR